MRRIRVIQIGIGHDHARSSFVTMKNHDEIFDVVSLAFPDEELCRRADYVVDNPENGDPRERVAEIVRDILDR